MHGMPIQFHGIDASPRTMITGEVFLQVEETTICLPKLSLQYVSIHWDQARWMSNVRTYSINLLRIEPHECLCIHFPTIKSWDSTFQPWRSLTSSIIPEIFQIPIPIHTPDRWLLMVRSSSRPTGVRSGLSLRSHGLWNGRWFTVSMAMSKYQKGTKCEPSKQKSAT